MSSATLGIQGRRIAASSQDLGQVLNGTLYGTTPASPIPPPLVQLDTLGARWTKTGKNFEASSSVSTYIPLQLPARPMDMPAKGGLFGKNLEPIGTTTAYVPLQIPARALNTPTTSMFRAKNLDPGYNLPIYIPIPPAPPAMDTPTTVQARAKNFEASYSASTYIPLQIMPPPVQLDTALGRPTVRAKNLDPLRNYATYIPFTFCIANTADDQYEVSSVASWTGTTPPPYAATFSDQVQLEIANQQYENGFLRWDTSSLAGYDISWALLRIYVTLGSRPQSGLTINGEWYTWNPDPGSGDYATPPGTSAFTKAFDSLPSAGFVDIVLANPNSNISRSGFTGLRLGFETSGGAPAGTNFFNIEDLGAGLGRQACLIVFRGALQIVQPFNYDTERTQGYHKHRTHDPSGNTTAYFPLKPSSTNDDWPNVGGLRAKNIEASGNTTLPIPPQLPNINTILPTLGRLVAKNLEPGGTWPIYVPPTPITRNYDWPTTNRHYAKRLPHAEYNGPIYIQSSVGLFSPYDAQIELPQYTEVIVLPAYLEELMLANYTGLLVTPIYSLESELPVYYSVRKL